MTTETTTAATPDEEPEEFPEGSRGKAVLARLDAIKERIEKAAEIVGKEDLAAIYYYWSEAGSTHCINTGDPEIGVTIAAAEFVEFADLFKNAPADLLFLLTLTSTMGQDFGTAAEQFLGLRRWLEGSIAQLKAAQLAMYATLQGKAKPGMLQHVYNSIEEFVSSLDVAKDPEEVGDEGEGSE